MENERKILLVDMNAYFASVEQQCNPALRGRPIVVCGEGRTIAVTASYEARAFGIKTGMTIPECRRLCPHVIPVVGNLDKYIDTSLRIHKIMLDFTDRVEVFSIDECFMDVTEEEKFFGGAAEIAKKIKQRIKNELGLLCSVGIAPNKTVAKLAAKSKKPDGLTEVEPEAVASFMENLPVEKLQGVGIGRHLSEKFRSLGIFTAKQLGEADVMMLTGHFGVLGRTYRNIGLGRDFSPVKLYNDKAPVKSVGHSHTLPADTRDISVIKSYMLMLCEKTAARLREYGLMARTVFLMIRWDDFDMMAQRTTLKHYFNSGAEICENAWKIFERAMPLKKAVRLIGVSVSGLSACDKQQYIFEDMQKRQRMLLAMDEINQRYGGFTARPAALLTAEKYG
ncbi:MAG TPA: DNA polymerase IV, partial [Candidatus Goldiibacteriota bacterium]|nr:DNA polymerase IV [Candidatus Goldiibacteriota bacterium]